MCGLSENAFTERYRKWCSKAGYYFSKDKAADIYVASCGHIGLLPKDEITELLIRQSIIQLNCICSYLAVIAGKMSSMTAMLPEYPIVIGFFGVCDNLGPRIIAEIGDVRRFARKESLVCFAGLEAPPYQSGKFESTDRSIFKKGSPHLRKALFQVMDCLLKKAPQDDPVFRFIDRNRAEGKHYYSYMTAGSAKFLRIYYARVKEHLDAVEQIS